MVFGDVPDEIRAQAGVAALVVELEFGAIEAHQPLLGADPDIAARILKDLLDGIHRQAVFGRIDAEVVLGDQFVGIESEGLSGQEG